MRVDRLTVAGGPFGRVLHLITDGLHRHRLLLLLVLVLNLGDAFSTHAGLARGLPEGNPIPAMLHAYGGPLAMFGVKFAVTAVMVLLVCLLGRRYPRLWHTFTVSNVVLLVAVLSNSAQIFAQ